MACVRAVAQTVNDFVFEIFLAFLSRIVELYLVLRDETSLLTIDFFEYSGKLIVELLDVPPVLRHEHSLLGINFFIFERGVRLTFLDFSVMFLINCKPYSLTVILA